MKKICFDLTPGDKKRLEKLFVSYAKECRENNEYPINYDNFFIKILDFYEKNRGVL